MLTYILSFNFHFYMGGGEPFIQQTIQKQTDKQTDREMHLNSHRIRRRSKFVYTLGSQWGTLLCVLKGGLNLSVLYKPFKCLLNGCICPESKQ